ncbi:thiamine phosphate synthase [Aerococcus kribbianus]|uniref:Thiamine-phosphate synthase n=1 Tax=Aerococcus kribbianus TaxID=2999064 RepID=A0A9X3FNW5_9LACT|nr:MULTISPECIES: thiamine phosphate synthase [unclassified Aerococcus]MCZ0717218.1 thiamine phosphate synthase [Aerococcus sp. YH-aer221]MCZ0725506.1 thiamine phosphate synthase [Aerococcus sp. YH-aer222]
MSMRENLNISHYLVIGPENTLGRDPVAIVDQAITAGIRCVQIRAKESSAQEIITLAKGMAQTIAQRHLSDQVCLLINDRLDVALACRDLGIKVDGVHVGQSDVPVEVCRHYLGPDAVIGFSAATKEMLTYVQNLDLAPIDYLGVGPLHPTATKADAGYYGDDDKIHLHSLAEIKTLAAATPIPIVVGGGVTVADLTDLVATGVAGYFVVSAIAGAQDPGQASHDLVTTWQAASKGEDSHV